VAADEPLFVSDAVVEEAEGPRARVRRLFQQAGRVDRRGDNARRRAGAKPPERQAEPLKRQRQADGRRVTVAARGGALRADVDHAAQEGAGRHNDIGRSHVHGLARRGAQQPEAGHGPVLHE